MEAEHFARRVADISDADVVGYELNAFLSAARSVTFLLQKEFAAVTGFEAWWTEERNRLRQDEAARFFLELRNFSQKQGPVSLVGTRNKSGRWYHMFAGTLQPVPKSLLNRDVADCCFEHLSKLARTILRFAEVFPFHSCPARALTPEGVEALGINLNSIEAALGFPPEFSSVRPEGTIADRTRLYRRYVDEVRFDEIQRIAHYMPEQPSDGADSAVSFAQTMAQQIELSRSTGMPQKTAVRVAIASEILRRNSDGT
jgi:hypothetical protein